MKLKNEITIMKKLLFLAAGAMLVLVACGLSAKPEQQDQGELRRHHADVAMTEVYGADWHKLYYDCGRTNHQKQLCMETLYKAAAEIRK